VPDGQEVDSVCPYCGVGCQLTYHVKDDRIVRVDGRDGPANQGRLCVKGRFGFDYARHPQRLTVPLIRRAGAPKAGDFAVRPRDWRDAFREASWDEALDLAGGRCAHPRHARPNALAGFGSAKGSNEEAYLFQKLVRWASAATTSTTARGCATRQSVAALLEGIGSGAVSNPVMRRAQAEVVIVIGANPTVNHPVAATWIKNAVRRHEADRDADPRRSDLARHATHFLQFKPDTDVALLNAMMHVIVDRRPGRRGLHRRAHRGFDALPPTCGLSPEAMAPICGIDAPRCARWRGCTPRQRASMILWGMGVSASTCTAPTTRAA
jgi:formate dehydrogenase major subunit